MAATTPPADAEPGATDPVDASAGSARDRILDAFEHVLVEHGERGATLEAVATAAGVSKGGLLYHFGGKEALVDGLLARMDELGRRDAQILREAESGPVDRWIRGSLSTATPFDRAYVATSRLAQGNHPRAREALTRLQDAWASVILEAVGDPAVARAILLIGDGLYYNSALQPWIGGTSGIPTDATGGDHASASTAVASLDDLIHVVEELVRLRSPRP